MSAFNRKMPAAAAKKDDDEDLYSGYNELNQNTDIIMKTVAATSKSNNDPIAALSAAGRPPTGSQAAAMGGGDVPAGGPEQPRPMTSVRAAGYSSIGKRNDSKSVFDPLKQNSGPAPPLQQRSADSPEYAARDLEKGVNRLMEESALANVKGDFPLALEKAKEAGKKERALCKHREKHNLADQINVELTYAVCFNLANQYHANGMLTEALNTYGVVVKNKQYPQAGRLRVNMGNIYYQQKKYPSAIKMYRMAMDQISGHNNASSRDMRFKIMRNIGDAFVKLGQFQDAIMSFEAIMDGTGIAGGRGGDAGAHAAAQAAQAGGAAPPAPDAQTGFNLIVCYYAVGDKEKMKKSFNLLLSVPEFHADEEEDDDDDHKKKDDSITIAPPPAAAAGPHSNNPNAPTNTAAARTAAAILAAAETVDELRTERANRRKRLHRYVLMAAKLIAPVIEKDPPAGFDWVIQVLSTPVRRPAAAGAAKPAAASAASANAPSGVKSSFASIAMEMEIAKGIAFLKKKEIQPAIEVFKSFERKDSQKLIDQAATNLSFLYFLEGDQKNAEKYAEMAVKADRYNAKALVNKANYIFAKGEAHHLEAAKELYLEAIGVEADCVEAIYNLGLTNKRLGAIEDALQAFKKLHRIIPKDPQVVYQIANLYELMDDQTQAADYFKLLHGAVPSDPKVLYRLGMLYNKEDDETQASHNFIESYQYYPVNMEVISWLGIWYVKSNNYFQAIQFFERAAEIAPDDVKWKLMVASCYRRNDDVHKALHLYKQIQKQEPDNIECLRYLCIICKDLNDPAWEEYNRSLKKAEREQQQRAQAGGAGGAAGGGFRVGEVNDTAGGNPNSASAGGPNGGSGDGGAMTVGPNATKLQDTPSTSPSASREGGPRPQHNNSDDIRKDLNMSFEQQQGGKGAAAPDANGDFKTHLSPKSQGRMLQQKEKGDGADESFDDDGLLP